MEAMGRLRPADLARVLHVYRDALRAHQEAINRLNVYPVPDGDTGTNMALTIESVVAELDASAGDGSMAGVCAAMAHGSLMGARGNSGVILSQLLRGMANVLQAGSDGEGAAGPDLADALVAASEAAYAAVLRPVEGTILTVARQAGEEARRAADDGAPLVEVADRAKSAGAEALAHTPDLLPALARAGVVDAGGVGFLLLIDSLLHVTCGRDLPEPPTDGAVVTLSPVGLALGEDGAAGAEHPEASPRYEVMYLLEARDGTIEAFKDVWSGLGDSIVVVGGDGLWNCHIHTDEVGPAIEAALDAGRPRNIRVTDLLEQVEEERWVREGAVAVGAAEVVEERPPRRTAVVAVANGEGIARIFRSLGVHDFVPGGQSMNPSTAQILEVVEAVPADEVVILPNNDNIHAVAMQACALASRPVRVVPTSGIVEGFAALLEYDPEAGADDNARAMSASARRVVAGEVVQAVRDAAGPEGAISAGDWLGMSREGIEVVAASLSDATCGLIGKLLGGDHELVTLIEGEGAGPAETRRVTSWLSEEHPDVVVEVHHGGQPLYPYLISIE